MCKKQYTKNIADKMRVKHGAQARFTVKTGNTVLQDDLMDVTLLGGAMTMAGYMYNALTVSGGVAWWNPANGKPIERPKVQMRVRPQDVLTGTQECDCVKCLV